MQTLRKCMRDTYEKRTSNFKLKTMKQTSDKQRNKGTVKTMKLTFDKQHNKERLQLTGHDEFS